MYVSLKEKNYSVHGEISSNLYNLTIGATLLYGFLINFLLVSCCAEVMMEINQLVFLIGYFVCAFSGIAMMRSSTNPLISFIGYNLLVVPIGCLLALCLPGSALASIILACVITAGTTLIMMIVGTIRPSFFEKISNVLFTALTICIIGEFILLLCGASLVFVDWIVAIIFCGYIGYDWGKANSNMYKTVDGAIDAAAELYLDIINLFLRILSILGKSDD